GSAGEGPGSAGGHESSGRDPGAAGGRPVVLWPDTFTNFFHPEVGRAAVAVLEAAGMEVRLPRRPVCCGLTLISTGQLVTAKRVLRSTLATLAPDLEAGLPVVGLEPSCTAVFRSDLGDLLPGDERAAALARAAVTLPEVLAREAPSWSPPGLRGPALVQAHCHHRAVLGLAADRDLLDRSGLDWELLDSGCCGLAGNFGFERGHYEVSMAVAERVLLPAVREAPAGTLVVADGFSCRTQVEQATGRRPLHLAQVLAGGLGTS
ncbi:MAG: (Fe-S)-binding protein, partial [Acidimicrobiales bacterium]